MAVPSLTAKAQHPSGLTAAAAAATAAGALALIPSTVTDLGIGLHLAFSDHVPLSWSVTGTVFSIAECVLAIDFLDDLSAQEAGKVLAVHGLASLAWSVVGLTQYKRPRVLLTPALIPSGPDGKRTSAGLALAFRW